MDFTMMRQMGRVAHVKAAFTEDESLRPLGEALEPIATTVDSPMMAMTGKEQAEFLAKGTTKLPLDEYNSLLWYLRQLGRPYFSVYASVRKLVDADTLLLPPYVRKRTEVAIGDQTFSIQKSHEGNSAVQFLNPRTNQRDTGNIEEIWTVPLDSTMSTFFIIRPHTRLSEAEEQCAPFASFNTKYATRIVDANPSSQPLIVEYQHIITHLSTYKRPAGTYGIPRETIVVCWALNRGKR